MSAVEYIVIRFTERVRRDAGLRLSVERAWQKSYGPFENRVAAERMARSASERYPEQIIMVQPRTKR